MTDAQVKDNGMGIPFNHIYLRMETKLLSEMLCLIFVLLKNIREKIEKTSTILIVIYRIYRLKNRNDFYTNYWYILKRSVVGTKQFKLYTKIRMSCQRFTFYVGDGY